MSKFVFDFKYLDAIRKDILSSSDKLIECSSELMRDYKNRNIIGLLTDIEQSINDVMSNASMCMFYIKSKHNILCLMQLYVEIYMYSCIITQYATKNELTLDEEKQYENYIHKLFGSVYGLTIIVNILLINKSYVLKLIPKDMQNSFSVNIGKFFHGSWWNKKGYG